MTELVSRLSAGKTLTITLTIAIIHPLNAFPDRRRLPVVLVRLKFVETVKEAVTFVEQGRKWPPQHSFCLLFSL